MPTGHSKSASYNLAWSTSCKNRRLCISCSSTQGSAQKKPPLQLNRSLLGIYNHLKCARNRNFIRCAIGPLKTWKKAGLNSGMDAYTKALYIYGTVFRVATPPLPQDGMGQSPAPPARDPKPPDPGTYGPTPHPDPLNSHPDTPAPTPDKPPATNRKPTLN